MRAEFSSANWQSVTIETCCDILDHKRIPVSTEERAKRKGKVPYYGANGQQGTIDGYIFDEDLILVAEDGGDFDHFATKPIAYRIAGKSWVNNHAHVLRVKECFDQPFVFHSLVHKDIRFFIRGGTRSKLNKGELLQVSLAVPNDKNEQRAVAAILDTADDAIRRTEAVIAKLRQVKAGMLHDLLTCGLDENGELRDPISYPEQFKDSPLGRIPKTWEIKGLLEVAPIVEGQVNPQSPPYLDYWLVAPDHIESGTGRLLSLATAREQGAISGKYHFQPGDVVYSKIRPYLRKAWLAPFGGLCSADMYPFRPSEGIDSHFLLMTLLSERFSNYAISVSERSGFPKINRSEISFFQFALPLKGEQERIATAIISIDEKIKSEETNKNKSQNIKQGLMQGLLTGRVRVPEAMLHKFQAEVVLEG